MIKNILFFFSIFILSSCSEKIEFKNLAIQKAIEMDCKDDVELLVKNENVELWASYNNVDTQLLCVYTCKDGKCFYSTERD